MSRLVASPRTPTGPTREGDGLSRVAGPPSRLSTMLPWFATSSAGSRIGQTFLQAATVLAIVLLLGSSFGCSRDARTARHLRRAQSALAQQQLDKAEIELLNVLRLDSTN